MAHSLLIVEDDADLRMLYKMFLKANSYSVQAAGSAEEALSLLANGKVDLILLDLTLPTMSGAEFMEQVRNDPQHSDTKVIVSSGWDDLKQKAQQMGADGYALKPTQLDALKAQIDSVLKR